MTNNKTADYTPCWTGGSLGGWVAKRVSGWVGGCVDY